MHLEEGENRFLDIYKRTFDFLRPLPPPSSHLYEMAAAHPSNPHIFGEMEKKEKISACLIRWG